MVDASTSAAVTDLDRKLNDVFPGRVVRKDLTQRLKEGANVPVYVLEYLLGAYCATDDALAIETGVARVKKILADNYVRPDEAERVKSRIREQGRFTVIDRVTVTLNDKADRYEAQLMNLGVSDIVVEAAYVTEFEKLLGGGIWCILSLEYDASQKPSPFVLASLKPVQMPSLDLAEVFEGRKAFSRAEWIDVLLRSTGLEPTTLSEEAKWHLIARMVPLIENNYNSCELGPRSTGKSHLYKEISPNTILVSGGQTTVANLFYNMARRQVGLVGLWDVVAFDEVAGISFKDKDGVQIMKDYMASGSFSRGKVQLPAKASMVFVGNVNQSIESLVKTSHLFAPFPEAMIDTAFLDRFHAYLPGWEIPKFGPENFTVKYGFIVDYLAEWLREMRKRSFADAADGYFKLGNQLKQRDVQGVRKTLSGMLKLLFPDGNYSKQDLEDVLVYALKGRRRVKEQLKKLGGMEFYDVHFSYIDVETMEERFVTLPEQSSGKLIQNEPLPAGHAYGVTRGSNDMIGLYKVELQTVGGSGKLVKTGAAAQAGVRDAVNVAFNYFKANSNRVSGSLNPNGHDYLLSLTDLQGAGGPVQVSLVFLVALFGASLGKSVQSQLAILGGITLGGTITPVDNLASSLQVAFDCGAKRILIPTANATDIGTVPGDLFAKFQTSFYSDPVDAVFKALGVN
ncbi:MAG: protease Lon-related BREX system protein BrxL [Deinococcota bacterium]|jgi:ATP-dependent Lon protease|nr:protease Lon-related BREX system protein BrxL [Deinococcota bacterium]